MQTGLGHFRVNLRAQGNQQASSNRTQVHVSTCQGSKTVRPTFCKIKADTAVNELFPEWRAAIGVANSHPAKPLN